MFSSSEIEEKFEEKEYGREDNQTKKEAEA